MATSLPTNCDGVNCWGGEMTIGDDTSHSFDELVPLLSASAICKLDLELFSCVHKSS